VGVTILYAILLAFTGLVFWSPGFLFTWVFDGVFQMARYPVGLYPGWLRLALTWVVPVGRLRSTAWSARTRPGRRVVSAQRYGGIRASPTDRGARPVT
jgi:hypothetical protein